MVFNPFRAAAKGGSAQQQPQPQQPQQQPPADPDAPVSSETSFASPQEASAYAQFVSQLLLRRDASTAQLFLSQARKLCAMALFLVFLVYAAFAWLGARAFAGSALPSSTHNVAFAARANLACVWQGLTGNAGAVAGWLLPLLRFVLLVTASVVPIYQKLVSSLLRVIVVLRADHH